MGRQPTTFERGFEDGENAARLAWEALQSDDERSAAEKIEAALKGLPDDARRRAIRKLRLEGAEKIKAAEQRKIDLDARRESIQRVVNWMELDTLTLQRPVGSAWHKLLEAYASGKLEVIPTDMDRAKHVEPFFKEPPHVFVIEHDWAAAFNGATDYAEGEYKLPFDQCCFEFRISGQRVLALDAGIGFQLIAIPGGEYWFCYPRAEPDHPDRIADPDANRGSINAASDLIASNIRAVCIALEAEVAVSDTVRAPYKLNAAREKKGQLPIADYHVVSLARRHRVAPLPAGQEPETGKVRLHFRRGHWRHYESHKTWIKWTLVGNPDLGFINKHYRL